MRKIFVAFATAFLGAAYTLAPLVSPALAANVAAANSVAIGNFTVYFPDGWSTIQSGRLTTIVNVPAAQQAALGNQSSRRIVGWSMSARLHGELVCQARRVRPRRRFYTNS